MSTAKRTGSIQLLMAGVIALTITVVLGLLGSADYFKAQERLTEQLHSELAGISGRLKVNLISPLWDMNMDSARGVLESEMSNRNLFSTVIIHKDKIVIGVGRDNNWNVVERKTAVTKGNYVIATVPLVYERNKKKNDLGTLNIYMSKKYLNEALNENLMGIIVRVVVMDCILVLALFILIRIFMMRPLNIIQTFTAKVQDGNLDAVLGQGRFIFELKDLKNGVESMVKILKSKMNEVKQKQEEALELADQANESARAADEARAAAELARKEGQAHAANVLENIVRNIDGSMQDLSELVERVGDGANRQSFQLAETATAMDEMNATVLEVAKNASNTSEQALLTKNEAQRGSTVVDQTLSAVIGMSTLTQQLVGNMTDLDHQADGIGAILAVISDIADQTNLLALNAAIEAARAGEAGRGFAVVADEVRKLAEKTMNATQQVDQSIRGLQNGAKTSTDTTNKAVISINETKELSEESGKALIKISELVELTSGLVTSIATAAEEQSATSEEITRSTNEISEISELTVEQMNLASSSIETMTAQVDELKSLIRSLSE
ncbi:methyl-accepting chemotaxis protein [Desulfovibrio sp. UCD-KL4C]|uniref:methyl-accepting chemotaxis protein n=1 Tax=Desulfovibrio sp. UCD-KL4C TaxID=2578120 RepID=UPI0025C5F5D1|nr:methyl-accepting chemotaxis protein [Desulfovibrio sp. UCD-KL4C]